MKIGIDFGTTRIVAAAADRGNYPLVQFEGPDGEIRDWFPPLVAVHGQRRVYGWETWAAQGQPGWTMVRSLKRHLKDAGLETQVQIGAQTFSLWQLLVELAAALHTQLREHSSLHAEPSQPLEVMLGVPANANSNQRFLTAEAFRAAGFEVLGLLNEPSAASIEFGHRSRTTRKGKSKSCLLVYDLGGGTFDASLVQIDEQTRSGVATAGIPTLGGDDFDEILAELAIESYAIRSDSLSQSEWFRLLEECREKKEALKPNTRKAVIDLERVREGWGEVSIPVSAFYERCRPLVEETRRAAEELLAANAQNVIETLYVTGGGAELPLVARILRDSFGRRVRRSAYMRATAIGLAIYADAPPGYMLRERFTHNFGVWRESDDGRNVVFDVLFPRGTGLPGPGEPPLRIARSYHPVHNIGHFRYLECSQVAADGRPVGDITAWDDIRFPFDAALQDGRDISSLEVRRSAAASPDTVEEVYTCDAGGAVTVTISLSGSGYTRRYRLGRWSGRETPIVPRRHTR